jgi:hypothetical protein
LNTVDESILSYLDESGKPYEYADDTFKSIHEIVVGTGHNLAYQTINNVMTLQRSHYGTIKQFVEAFRSAIADANRLTKGKAFIPYVASAMLLRMLDSELHAWVEIKQNEYMTDGNAIDMELTDFHRLCDLAIDKARFTENHTMLAKSPKTRSNSISSPKEKTNLTLNDKSTSNKQKEFEDNISVKRRERQRSPPKDMNIATYTRIWREFPTQKDNDGNCMFCNLPGHT